jgi:hypothetical protein
MDCTIADPVSRTQPTPFARRTPAFHTRRSCELGALPSRSEPPALSACGSNAIVWLATRIRDARGSLRPPLSSGGGSMPLYLARFRYTTDAVKALVKQP